MSPEDRHAIRILIDRRRRELVADDRPDILERPKWCAGTAFTYKKGCRCQDCRAASAAAKTRQRRNGINVQVHNRNGYSSGCRCVLCRLDHNERTRVAKRRKRDQVAA